MKSIFTYILQKKIEYTQPTWMKYVSNSKIIPTLEILFIFSIFFLFYSIPSPKKMLKSHPFMVHRLFVESSISSLRLANSPNQPFIACKLLCPKTYLIKVYILCNNYVHKFILSKNTTMWDEISYVGLKKRLAFVCSPKNWLGCSTKGIAL